MKSGSARFARRTAPIASFLLLFWPHFLAAQTSDSPSDTTFLDQGWSEEERLQYYFTSQGSAALPYELYLHLEEAESQQLFRSDAVSEKFGLIPHPPHPQYNPDGLPIGIAKRSVPDGRWQGDWVGVTCAACHNSELRYQGATIRIDGGSNNRFEFASYIAALGAALEASLDDGAKFQRLADRMGLTGVAATTRLREQLEIAAREITYYADVSAATPFPFGPGRMDPLTVIHNRVLANALGVPENTEPSLIPTKSPFLWDAPQSSWVQWTGFGLDPLHRNAGESLGAFVKIDLTSPSPEEGLFDSTIDLAGQLKIERLLRELAPPQWPEEVLGEIDRDLANRGRDLYAENCVECHSVYPHRWSEPKLQGKRFIENALVPFDIVGTDPMQATGPEFDPRPRYRPGNMAAYLPAPYRDRPLVPQGVIFETIQENVVAKAVEGLDLTEADVLDAMGYRERSEPGPVQPVYKAGPRDGIWATPPYLHNSSVPSLYDLLSPASERPQTFYVGREFDPIRVGIDTSGASGADLFDTRLIGNSNAGHSFEDGPRANGVIGRLLSEDERWALIEYLKSIPTEPGRVTPYGGPENPISAWEDETFFHNQHGNADVYRGGYQPSDGNADAPEADDEAGLGQEVIEPDEAALIDKIRDLTLQQLQARLESSGGPAVRAAHAKTHALVRAEFIVLDGIPEDLRHGVFSTPRVFDAIIRFSAALGQVQPDTVQQPRGMAIKLLGVDGPKLLDDEPGARTQDFVMINYPTFFIGNLENYVGFVSVQGEAERNRFFDAHPDIAEAFKTLIGSPFHNPIQARYWSQTPYRLGPHAIKFSASPLSRRADAELPQSGPDFLRAAIVEQVGQEDIYYEFLIQLQQDPVTMPIEDPMVEWDESISPFRRVALIRIPRQDISPETNLAVAEDLSFTPWRSLPDHRPLGSINRARRVVYDTISEFRHKYNQAQRQEPAEMPVELAK